MKKIQDLSKNEPFKRKSNSKLVYIKNRYNRITKKYSCSAYCDISKFIELKKDTLVFVDFEF